VFAGLTFLGAWMFVLVTPQILYRLTDSLAAAFALVGIQLLVTAGHLCALYPGLNAALRVAS
jgi:hypothetical protein